MVRTLLRKVATPPHLSSELCFAKRSATAASFFAVHWSKHFATQNGLLSKFCYAKPPIQNFASQSGLRPPHHGQSILIRKTVFDRPVFFGVHTLRFIARSKFSELYLILKLYKFELNNNLKNIRKAHVITHELFLYFKLWLCLCF